MIESPVFDEFVDHIHQLCKDHTRSEDMIEGWFDGLRKGYREGSRETAQWYIISVLRHRFENLPIERIDELKLVDNKHCLEQLLIAATNCPGLDEFFARVAATQPES